MLKRALIVLAVTLSLPLALVAYDYIDRTGFHFNHTDMIIALLALILVNVQRQEAK